MSEVTLYTSEEFVVKGQYHENYPNELFIHCEVHRWGIKQYRKMVTVWSVILDELHERGCYRVNTVIPKRDTKTRRFQTMFGLTPAGETADYVKYTLIL